MTGGVVAPMGSQYAWESDPANPWMDRAECAKPDVDLAVFFPMPQQSANAARRVCVRCPVVSVCLDYAMENDFHDGVWGGMTAQERRALRGRVESKRSPEQVAAAAASRARRREWTADEDAALVQLTGERVPNAEIGRRIGRDPSTVRSRQSVLGLRPARAARGKVRA